MGVSKKKVVVVVCLAAALVVVVWVTWREVERLAGQRWEKSADEAGNQSTAPADENPPPSFREVYIKAEEGRFVPAEVTAKKGDQIIINFTAIDGAYDFGFADPKIGFDVIVKKGETKTFGFTAKDAGTFIFYCIQFCPTGKKMEGTLVVTE